MLTKLINSVNFGKTMDLVDPPPNSNPKALRRWRWDLWDLFWDQRGFADAQVRFLEFLSLAQLTSLDLWMPRYVTEVVNPCLEDVHCSWDVSVVSSNFGTQWSSAECHEGTHIFHVYRTWMYMVYL